MIRPINQAAALQRTIEALPVTQQIALIQRVVEGAGFADFDCTDTDALDRVLASLHAQSVAAYIAEQEAMHGKDIAA